MSCPPAPTSDAERLEDALKVPRRVDLTRTLPWRIVWQVRCIVCGSWLPDDDAPIPAYWAEDMARCTECADKATRR